MPAQGTGPLRPRGVHHAGLVVSDIERAIAFYGEHFGARPTLRVDHDRGRLAMLDFGNTNLELLSYARPGRIDGVPAADDLGAGHVALLFDDVAAVSAQLRARGVAFEQEPMTIRDGPSAGYVIAFCLDPDGNRVELIQQP